MEAEKKSQLQHPDGTVRASPSCSKTLAYHRSTRVLLSLALSSTQQTPYVLHHLNLFIGDKVEGLEELSLAISYTNT